MESPAVAGRVDLERDDAISNRLIQRAEAFSERTIRVEYCDPEYEYGQALEVEGEARR
jgi:hypothetical protein